MYTIIERPDNNVQYIRIKNPKLKRKSGVKTDPVYLCTWDWNAIVEVHTAFTLKEVYGEAIDPKSHFTNLHSKGFLFIDQILDPKKDLLGLKYCCDNMTIERIK